MPSKKSVFSNPQGIQALILCTPLYDAYILSSAVIIVIYTPRDVETPSRNILTCSARVSLSGETSGKQYSDASLRRRRCIQLPLLRQEQGPGLSNLYSLPPNFLANNFVQLFFTASGFVRTLIKLCNITTIIYLSSASIKFYRAVDSIFSRCEKILSLEWGTRQLLAHAARV